MMKKIISCLLILFLIVHATGSDVIYPTGVEDSEIKNLEWNRYVSGNFTILSIDNSQGKWLYDNINQLHAWSLAKWGFPLFDVSKEVRIFCVPNKSLFKKLFNLDKSKFEVRKDLMVLWLVLDDNPSKTILPYLTELSLAEFELHYSVKIGWWFKRGVVQLNESVKDIKSHIVSFNEFFDKDKPIFISEKIFTMTEEEYNKLSVEHRKIFDIQSMFLCILLRKEFGEVKLQGFLRISNQNDPQSVLNMVYGFSDYDQFDKKYVQFMLDLTSDVMKDRTPNSYLEFKPR